MRSNNGLGRKSRPTQNSYQSAIREMILSIQGDMTDDELADRLGCSAGTISNARNKKGCLSPVTLAQIGHEFGPDAVNPFMGLFSAIAIYARGSAANDFHTIAGLSHVAGDWIDRLRDGTRCHNDTIALANALRPLVTALQGVIEEADRHRSDAA